MKKLPSILFAVTLILVARYVGGMSGLWLISDKDQGLSFWLINASGIATLCAAVNSVVKKRRWDTILIIAITVVAIVISDIATFFPF